MYKTCKILAVIPARGGSKGIPRKNIKKIKDKPLIAYTIDAAIRSKYIDQVVVSTDDEEIAQYSIKYGAKVPFIRPKELATDFAKTIDVILHTIKTLETMGLQFDFVVTLQPTQPLRQTIHIDESIQHIIENKEDSLISVTKVKEHPIFMRTIAENQLLQPLLLTNSTVRRQDLPLIYKVNGSIYINKIDSNLTESISLNDNKLAYVMDEAYDLDIDTIEDLEYFDYLISKIEEVGGKKHVSKF